MNTAAFLVLVDLYPWAIWLDRVRTPFIDCTERSNGPFRILKLGMRLQATCFELNRLREWWDIQN